QRGALGVAEIAVHVGEHGHVRARVGAEEHGQEGHDHSVDVLAPHLLPELPSVELPGAPVIAVVRRAEPAAGGAEVAELQRAGVAREGGQRLHEPSIAWPGPCLREAGIGRLPHSAHTSRMSFSLEAITWSICLMPSATTSSTFFRARSASSPPT